MLENLNDRVRGIRGTHREYFRRSDEQILEEACELLYQNPYVDATDIEVAVERGSILLSGSVSSREMKREAEICVERIRGVDDVRNEITILLS
jgi:osmotically-inducible protein OsmY